MKQTIRRVLLALLAYFLGEGTTFLLKNLWSFSPLGRYFILVATYFIIGSVFSFHSVSRPCTKKGLIFLSILSLVLAVWILVPITPVPSSVASFWLSLHVEIFPSFLLGFCLLTLIQSITQTAVNASEA
jgi:hypothetical protein